VKLFYFGAPSRELFGASETPRISTEGARAAILCYPMGQEYLRAHRAFRNLSQRLSKAGWHVLRFEYYGTGDSTGASDEVDVEQWRNDIVTAIGQARSIDGISSVSLIGLRLGATLATLVAAERDDIDQLVLWDPILDGNRCLEEQVGDHRSWLKSRSEMGWDPPRQDDEYSQALGFPITNKMRTTLEQVDLTRLTERPARSILVVEAGESEATKRLVAHLRALDCDVNYRCLPEAQIWLRLTMNQRVVPTRTLEQIVEWISRTEN